MDELTAYCGLDCRKCDARIATITDDDALREKVAALWSRLNGVEITPGMINCAGCKAHGVKTSFCESLCEIRKCAESKELEACSGCRESQFCELLKAMDNYDPNA